MTSPAATTATFVTPEAFLAHWQGHRALTRRLIEVYPEDQLFSYSVGGMRPFGALALEMIGMAVPTAHGVLTDEWKQFENAAASTRAELLEKWDESTARLNEIWPKIPADRFQVTVTAFGQWTMPVHDLFLYVVDNEIHHRGQGYVYMRTLGIEPPPFWERG